MRSCCCWCARSFVGFVRDDGTKKKRCHLHIQLLILYIDISLYHHRFIVRASYRRWVQNCDDRIIQKSLQSALRPLPSLVARFFWFFECRARFRAFHYNAFLLCFLSLSLSDWFAVAKETFSPRSKKYCMSRREFQTIHFKIICRQCVIGGEWSRLRYMCNFFALSLALYYGLDLFWRILLHM